MEPSKIYYGADAIPGALATDYHTMSSLVPTQACSGPTVDSEQSSYSPSASGEQVSSMFSIGATNRIVAPLETTYDGQAPAYSSQTSQAATYTSQTTSYGGQAAAHANTEASYTSQAAAYSSQAASYNSHAALYNGQAVSYNSHAVSYNSHAVSYNSHAALYNDIAASCNGQSQIPTEAAGPLASIEHKKKRLVYDPQDIIDKLNELKKCFAQLKECLMRYKSTLQDSDYNNIESAIVALDPVFRELVEILRTYYRKRKNDSKLITTHITEMGKDFYQLKVEMLSLKITPLAPDNTNRYIESLEVSFYKLEQIVYYC